MRPPLTSRSMVSRSLTYTGRVSPPVSLPCWPWLSSASLSPDAVTSGEGVSDSLGPAMRSFSSPLQQAAAIPTPRPGPSPAPTPVLHRLESSGPTLSSSTLLRTSQSSTPPSALPPDSQLSNFPPLPPPADCQGAPRSTSISTRPRPLLPSSRLPTTRGSPEPSTSSRVARQESTPFLEDSALCSAPRPVHSVGAYNRSGLRACDQRSGSVARMTVHF